MLVEDESVVFFANECFLSLVHKDCLLRWWVVIIIALVASNWNFCWFRIFIDFDFSDLNSRSFLLQFTWTWAWPSSLCCYRDSLWCKLVLDRGWLRAMALKRLAIAVQTTSVHMKVISLALDLVWSSDLATRRTLSMLLNCSLDSDICDLTTLTCFGPCHRGRFWRIFVCTFDLETWINEGR